MVKAANSDVHHAPAQMRVNPARFRIWHTPAAPPMLGQPIAMRPLHPITVFLGDNIEHLEDPRPHMIIGTLRPDGYNVVCKLASGLTVSICSATVTVARSATVADEGMCEWRARFDFYDSEAMANKHSAEFNFYHGSAEQRSADATSTAALALEFYSEANKPADLLFHSDEGAEWESNTDSDSENGSLVVITPIAPPDAAWCTIA